MSDRRLMLKIILILEEKFASLGESAAVPAENLSEATLQWYTKVWQAFFEGDPLPLTVEILREMVVTMELSELISNARQDDDEEEDVADSIQEIRTDEKLLLPIQCPLVDEFVDDIKENLATSNIEDPRVRAVIVDGNEFDEKYHWHSGKPLEDDIDFGNDFKEKRLSHNRWERREQIRAKQKFANYNKWYGETLEGNLYKAETIILENNSEHGHKTNASSGHGEKGVGKAKLTKREQMVLENKTRKEAEAAKKEEERWHNLLSESKSMGYKEQYCTLLNKVDYFLECCEHRSAKKRAIIFKVKLLWNMWKEHCKNDTERRDLSLVVNLVRQVHYLLLKENENLTPRDKKSIAKHMARLGFNEDARKIYPALQRKLLNAVDNNQSALIIAPTSSGKTFASYYCIEKVLRESNDGVVVYVAPTKALVNQVAAVVYARFHRKQMPEGRAVFGTFTRDYRNDALTCQVLITVPQCLEILMMSPKRQDWVAKMRYVIFDEIHCLGGEIGAEVWEHLLMLIRCPFLALSATISNPEYLLGWLQRAAKIRREQDASNDTASSSTEVKSGKRKGKDVCSPAKDSYDVRLVEYSERHSDLVKHNCVPVDTAPNNITEGSAERKSEGTVSETEGTSDDLHDKVNGIDFEIEDDSISDDDDDDDDSDIDVEYDGNSVNAIRDNSPSRTIKQKFVQFHPVGVLSKQQLLSLENLPGDMSLSVMECVQLYDAMVKTGTVSDTLEKLHPDVYFGDVLGDHRVAIYRNEVREYEKELKKTLVEWVNNKNMTKEVDSVLQSLKPDVNTDNLSRDGKIENREGIGYMTRNIMPLLKSLHEQEKLPCLIFRYDRNGCEILAQRITLELEAEEEALRESELLRPMFLAVEKYAKQFKKFTKQARDSNVAEPGVLEIVKAKKHNQPQIMHTKSDRKACERLGQAITKEHNNHGNQLTDPELVEKMFGNNRQKQPRKLDTQMPEKTKATSGKEAMDVDSGPNLMPFVSNYRKAMAQVLGTKNNKLLVPDIKRLKNPLPNCTFCGEGQVSDEEWEKIIGRLGLPDDDIFVRCLKRGVAYHHAGLGERKRVAVEILFRKKFLKAVFATGTLALGVHMPCRSVIFAGDSPYLTPIQYRQMSGRAGRRGFDIKGDIYFFGIPEVRIRQLMSSGLPQIQGNFPVTATCILRLMLMCNTGTDPVDAVKRTLVLLKNPLMCYKKPQLMSQVKRHFLFCIQFLMRRGLLNERGVPQGLTGLATHLHYHEPANFVVIYFLQLGLFHNLCKPEKDGSFSEEVMREMVLVLANLFGRRYLHEDFINRMKPKSSIVKLPPLPKSFSRALRAYNKHVEQTFSYYLETVSEYVDRENGGHDRVLPLSEIDFSKSLKDTSGFSSQIAAGKQPIKVCSSFAALSGNTDYGVGFKQMLNNIPHDVYCESDVLPILQEEVHDRNGSPMYLNAYALDFYKHGSQITIINDNHIMPGDVFFLLQDFLRMIQTITIAVQQLGPEEDNVIRAFLQLRDTYKELFKTNFGWDKLQ